MSAIGAAERARDGVRWLFRWTGLLFLLREVFQRRRMTILFLHDTTPERLDGQLAVLSSRYAFVPLRDMVDSLTDGSPLPPKAVAVTLDDGHRSDRELLDVFEKHGVRPTIFICTGLVGTNRGFWWEALTDEDVIEQLKELPDQQRLDRLEAAGFSETTEYPERTALSLDEIAEMRGLVDFQPHTVLHPMLSTCSDERSHEEIVQSKRWVEDELGVDAYVFAYPNGAYSEREVETVRAAGFTYAVTTDVGLNTAQTDPMLLKRVHLPESASPTAVLFSACVVPAMAAQTLTRSRA